ncbi:hypothetical protein [Arthrobacter sp. lap29]|uniref:hypothetical protein n=1 Tax=Arthrobacter sp. lap29 TaxID=3056122 RepID=UPI0028F6E365|nr:hypothetical protein [Arthrobacter sp. lap29]
MTKLIAALAILAALAWAITAVASWIAKKKAPLALAAGKVSLHASAAEEDKALLKAQWRTAAAAIFAAIMFLALFRISIGLSGQAGLPIAMTTGLSASGGLLLFSALPATKLSKPSNPTKPTNPNSPSTQFLPRRTFILPAATLIIFTAFTIWVLVTELAPGLSTMKSACVPLLLVAMALSASSLLVLHRLSTTAMLPDPRMAALDRRWREISAGNLLHFTSGALLSTLATAAIFTGAALNAPTAASPQWATVCLIGGSLAGVSGVVLLVLAAKGTLSIRATVRKGAPVPITA